MEDPNKEKLKQELQNMIQNIDFEKDKYSVLWEVKGFLTTMISMSSGKDIILFLE